MARIKVFPPRHLTVSVLPALSTFICAAFSGSLFASFLPSSATFLTSVLPSKISFVLDKISLQSSKSVNGNLSLSQYVTRSCPFFANSRSVSRAALKSLTPSPAYSNVGCSLRGIFAIALAYGRIVRLLSCPKLLLSWYWIVHPPFWFRSFTGDFSIGMFATTSIFFPSSSPSKCCNNARIIGTMPEDSTIRGT